MSKISALTGVAAKVAGGIARGTGKVAGTAAKGTALGGAALLGAGLGNMGNGAGSGGGLKPVDGSAVLGNMGVFGQYGQGRFAGADAGGSNVAGAAQVVPKRMAQNDNYSTNKLLTVAINFLSSLDASIKNQFNLQKAFYAATARNDKETRLEGSRDRAESSQVIQKSGEANQAGGGLAGILKSALLPLGLLAAGAAAGGLGGKNNPNNPLAAMPDGVGNALGAAGTGIGLAQSGVFSRTKGTFFGEGGVKTQLTAEHMKNLEAQGYKPRGGGFVNSAGKFVSDSEVIRAAQVSKSEVMGLAKKLVGPVATKIAGLSVAFEALDYLISGKSATAGNLLTSGLGILGGVIGGFLGGAGGSIVAPGPGTAVGAIGGAVGGDSVGRWIGDKVGGFLGLAKDTTPTAWTPRAQEGVTDSVNMTTGMANRIGRVGSGTTAGATGGINSKGPAGRIMKKLVNNGLTEYQAAAVVGHWKHESSLQAGRVNSNDRGMESIGLAQWRDGRNRALRAFAERRGTSWKDEDTQIAYFFKELNSNEAAAGKRLRSARNLNEASAAMSAFERYAGWNGRGRTAKDVAHGRQQNAARLRSSQEFLSGKDLKEAKGAAENAAGMASGMAGRISGSNTEPGQRSPSSSKMYFGDQTQDVALKGRHYNRSKGLTPANDQEQKPQPVVIVSSDKKTTPQTTSNAPLVGVPNPGNKMSAALSYQLYFGINR